MFKPYTNNALGTDLIAVLPNDSTVTGFVSSTDVGRLAFASSQLGGLMLGSTADFSGAILGIIASVPTATTPGSTVPFYIRPIVTGALYEADFSTTYSAQLPATTDIGKFIGVSNTTTVAGGSYLSMAGIGNAAGSVSARFFRIARATSADVERRVVLGTFNSSHIGV
ncbi:MAG: hypothetical protein RL463_816 [Bacteroidota bacterium]|jgi:hypothetical protein